MELPRMLPGLVFPPDCTHIPMSTASAFYFSLVYFPSHALNLNLYHYLSIPLTSVNATPYPPTPPYHISFLGSTSSTSPKK